MAPICSHRFLDQGDAWERPAAPRKVLACYRTRMRWSPEDVILRLALLVAFAVPCAARAVTIDPVERTASTAELFVDWGNGNTTDVEAIAVIQWRGGPNLTKVFGSGLCADGDIEYFGNSWAGGAPQQRNTPVLVGAGSNGTWRKVGARRIEIRTTSSVCAASARVPVKTSYVFSDDGRSANTLRVKRTFRFDRPFRHDFRPYMPRLTVADFTQTLHPDAGGTRLVTEEVLDCAYARQESNWNGSWYAIYAPAGPLAGQGMVILRKPSSFAVQLWVDYDGGSPTNATSVLALQPPGGFRGRVTEEEVLCFFDSATWTPALQDALTLPGGCALHRAGKRERESRRSTSRGAYAR